MMENPLTNLSTAEHWMAQAYELAQAAAYRDEVPVGAVLVNQGSIIGAGANSREQTSRTVAHAEIMALEDFSRRTNSWRLPVGTFLFVTVEPCLMCTGALLWARVDGICYGCTDPKNAGLQCVRPLIQAGAYDHRFSDIRGGILAERCAGLISGYFRQKRAGHSKKEGELNPSLS